MCLTVALLQFVSELNGLPADLQSSNSTDVVILSNDNITSIDRVPSGVNIVLENFTADSDPDPAPHAGTSMGISPHSIPATRPQIQPRQSPPRMQIMFSNHTVRSSIGRPLFATAANQSTLLEFLKDARDYAEGQEEVHAKGNESNSYFRYTGDDYTLAYIVYNQTNLGPDFSEWSYIWTCIDVLYNETLNNLEQNTTWVARVWDPAGSKTADMLIVPPIQDIYPPAGFTFNTTNDEDFNTTGLTLPSASASATAVPIAVVDTDLAIQPEPIPASGGNDRRDLLPPSMLETRAIIVGFDRWNNLGHSGYQFSIRRSLVNMVPRALMFQLIQAAYDTLRADSGRSNGGYFAFTQTLPQSTVAVAATGASSSGSEAAAADFAYNSRFVQFDFQISGLGHIEKRLLAELALVLFRIAQHNRWQARPERTQALYGEIVSPQGHLVGRWTFGFLLDQLQPVLGALNCAVGGGQGAGAGSRNYGSCLVRDEL